jgi:hypothetical protein
MVHPLSTGIPVIRQSSKNELCGLELFKPDAVGIGFARWVWGMHVNNLSAGNKRLFVDPMRLDI